MTVASSAAVKSIALRVRGYLFDLPESWRHLPGSTYSNSADGMVVF